MAANWRSCRSRRTSPHDGRARIGGGTRHRRIAWHSRTADADVYHHGRTDRRPYRCVALDVIQGSRSQTLTFDDSEFNSVRWFAFDALPVDRTDPHLQRFVQKLAAASPFDLVKEEASAG